MTRVGHSRTCLADYEAIEAAFATVGRVAIIGGGWIGLEIAAAASAVGREAHGVGSTPNTALTQKSDAAFTANAPHPTARHRATPTRCLSDERGDVCDR